MQPDCQLDFSIWTGEFHDHSQKRISIFYTHKNSPIEEDHVRTRGRESLNLLIPFIEDESSTILRSWYVASAYSGWDNVSVFCSCEKNDFEEKLFRDNLILIGSSKFNRKTEHFLKLCQTSLDYTFVPLPSTTTGHSIEYGIKHSRFDLKDALAPSRPKGSRPLKDYALFTRVRNPLSGKSFVFILAGCKAAGQLALERFIFCPEVLEKMTSNSDYQEGKPFEVVIEVEYLWGDGAPILGCNNDNVEIKILDPKGIFDGDRLILGKSEKEKQTLELRSGKQ